MKTDSWKKTLRNNPGVIGVLAGLLGACTYGMNPLFALPLFSEGFTADAVLFCRYLPALVMIGCLMYRKRISFAAPLPSFGLFFCGGMLFGISSLTLFLSYTRMEAGIASTLLFVYPVMTAFIMWAFFRERASLRTWFAIALALTGIALLYKKTGGGMLSTAGVLLVMGSALSYAIYLVMVNRTRLCRENAWRTSFYVLLSGTMIYAVRLCCHFGHMGNFSVKTIVCIFFLALLPTLVSIGCTTLAIQRIGATPTAVLGALEPLTAVFFGVLVFHEGFSFRIGCGILLILSAVILIVLRSPKRQKKAS